MVKRLERHRTHVKYITSEGQSVVGASTIAGINKPISPLMWWAWKLGKEGKDFKKEMNQAADYGTIAHFMIECHITGDDPDLSEFSEDEIEIADVAYKKFLQFWEDNKFEVVEHELPLVSQVHGFGGTMDLVARNSKGEIILFDYKTSKAIYESHRYQIAGYFQLWNENRPELPIDRAVIVRVGRSPKDPFELYWIPPSRMPDYWDCFAARLSVYNADKKVGS